MGIYGEFENVGQMVGPIVAGLTLAAGGIEIAFVCLAGVVLVGFALTVSERASLAPRGKGFVENPPFGGMQ